MDSSPPPPQAAAGATAKADTPPLTPPAAEAHAPIPEKGQKSALDLSSKDFPHYVQKITALTDNVEPLLKQAVECQIDVVPEWAKPEVEARFYIVVDGKIDEQPVGPIVRAKCVSLIEGAMKQFSKFTLNQIHHYATLGAYINDLNRVHKLTDVFIHLDGEIFAVTRHVLSCHSQFFASLFVNSRVPHYAVTELTLVNIDKNLFKLFLHFVHFGNLYIDDDLVGPMLELSDILQSQTIKAKAVQVLNGSPTTFDRVVAIYTLVRNFADVIDNAHCFKLISVEDMKEILSSNDLNIKTELDAFWAVLYWIICDQDKRLVHLDTLMPCVRFTCMSSLELLDCARASNVMSVSSTCKNLLVNAHWVSHAQEIGIPDPLLSHTALPRSHLIDAPPYVPTVQEFDLRYMVYMEINVMATNDSLLSKTNEDDEDDSSTGRVSLFSSLFGAKKEKKDKGPKKRVTKHHSETENEKEDDSSQNTEDSKENGSIDEKDGKEEDERNLSKEMPLATTPDKKGAGQQGAGQEDSGHKKGATRGIEKTHEFKDGTWRRKRHRTRGDQRYRDLLKTSDDDRGDDMGSQLNADNDLPEDTTTDEDDTDGVSSLQTSKEGRITGMETQNGEENIQADPLPEPNFSQDDRRDRSSMYSVNEDDHSDDSPLPSAANLLETPDRDMSLHLQPVLQPIQTSRQSTSLFRENIA